ncbi:helix-turn-helix domain-containing protein [Methylosinus sp. Sm6]|uniref:helix-turn-helix domain-containing protein n=1 Tax=Methylosinus sp. Sm6 TaxID=2866948 RepID=UPI001C991B89|nr:helix-turn-helix domain-containing protein [Methylosinus sp. Sm6]
MSASPQIWDRHAIVAELRRHRSSLAAVGRTVGLSRQSMYWALFKPHRRANMAIAAALGVRVCELWPEWFDADGKLISCAPRLRRSSKPIPRSVRASSERSAAA